MSTRKLLLAILTAALVLGACSGSTSGTTAGTSTTNQPAGTTDQQTTTTATTATKETAPEGASGNSDGSCTVEVTGDRELTWTFDQSIYSFSSDYWLSEGDLRDTVETIGEDNMGGSYDEIVASGKPVITFLQISCANPDDLIQGALITMTNATTSSDIPMGPATYPISGGVFDADGPAATAVAEFDVSSDELYGTIGGSGSLVLVRWDSTRIEGSYSFDAKESFVDSPREVHVSVTFSFACDKYHTACG